MSEHIYSSQNEEPTFVSSPTPVGWAKISEGSESWLYGVDPNGDGSESRIETLRRQAASEYGGDIMLSMNGATSKEGNRWNRAVNAEGPKKFSGDLVYSVLARVVLDSTTLKD